MRGQSWGRDGGARALGGAGGASTSNAWRCKSLLSPLAGWGVLAASPTRRAPRPRRDTGWVARDMHNTIMWSNRPAMDRVGRTTRAKKRPVRRIASLVSRQTHSVERSPRGEKGRYGAKKAPTIFSEEGGGSSAPLASFRHPHTRRGRTGRGRGRAGLWGTPRGGLASPNGPPTSSSTHPFFFLRVVLHGGGGLICASPLPLGIGRGKGGVGKPKQRRELYCAKRGCFCVVFVFWGGGGGWFTPPPPPPHPTTHPHPPTRSIHSLQTLSSFSFFRGRCRGGFIHPAHGLW